MFALHQTVELMKSLIEPPIEPGVDDVSVDLDPQLVGSLGSRSCCRPAGMPPAPCHCLTLGPSAAGKTVLVRHLVGQCCSKPVLQLSSPEARTCSVAGAHALFPSTWCCVWFVRLAAAVLVRLPLLTLQWFGRLE